MLGRFDPSFSSRIRVYAMMFLAKMAVSMSLHVNSKLRVPVGVS